MEGTNTFLEKLVGWAIPNITVEKIKGQGEIMFMFNNNYDLSTRYVYQKDFAKFRNIFFNIISKILVDQYDGSCENY